MTHFKKILIEVAVVIVLLIGLLIVADRFLASKNKNWMEGLAALASKYPATGVNQTALDLEDLAARIGVDMAPRGMTGRAQSSEQNRKEFEEIKQAMKEYVDRQLSSADDSIAPVPEKLAAFLQKHQAEVDSAYNLLRNSEPPRWDIDISKGPDAPIPYLPGQMFLQRVFVLDILNRMQRRDTSVENSILTAYEMNAALNRRPEIICLNVASNIWKMHIGLLRKLPSTSLAWLLKELDQRDAYYINIQLEAWMLGQIADQEELRKKYMPPNIPAFLVRFGLNDIWKTTELCLNELKKADPCGFRADEFNALYRPAKWNVAGSVLWYDKGESYQRVCRLLIDAEMTRKILEAKAQRTEDGMWAKKIPGIERSTCQNAMWNYEVLDDGTMRLSFNKKLPAMSGAFELPLTHTAGMERN